MASTLNIPPEKQFPSLHMCLPSPPPGMMTSNKLLADGAVGEMNAKDEASYITTCQSS